MKYNIKNTTHLYIMAAFLLLSNICFAQTDSAKMKKMEELRTLIIIEKLSLTPKEQKDFLPLYHAYKNAEIKLQKQINSILKNGNKEEVSQEKATKLLDSLQKLQLLKLNLLNAAITKFKTVLPATKILKLFIVEKEIHRLCAQKLREKKGEKK